jgi:heat shock protein HtpX
MAPTAPQPGDDAPSTESLRASRTGRANLDAHRRALAPEISAYPATVTYVDLIRRNKRESVVLIVAMMLLAMALGAAIAAVLGAYYGGVPRGEVFQALLPSIVLGAVVALVFASLGATWSWFGGASAILRMSGARQIQKEDDPELFNVVDEARLAAGLPMPAVYLIQETALNAFATGRDPEHASVAITTGLRQKLSRDELQGVMAHEVAHIRHYDIRFAMLMATMVGLIVFACDAFWRIGLRSARFGGMGGGRRRSSGRGEGGGGGIAIIVLLAIAVLLAILAPIFARLIQMTYSRRREYLADAGAVELTRNPEGLAAALAKLADDAEPLVEAANRGTAHLFIVNPLSKMRRAHQQLDSLFASHPPIQKRIARLLALSR